MGDKKSHNKNDLVLLALEKSGFLSQVENMTIKDIKEKLSEQGYCGFFDILTISLLVYKLLTDQEKPSTPLLENDQEMKELLFAVRYDLSKDDVATLKAFMKHANYEKTGDVLCISADTVNKRMRKIYRQMKVTNKIHAAQLVGKYGIAD
jgi:DNA-binding CsgD family transcriptional regulator